MKRLRISRAVGALALLCALLGTSANAQLTQTDPNGLAFLGSFTSEAVGVYRMFNTGSVFDGNLYRPPNPGFGSGVMWIGGPTVGGPDPKPNEVDTDLTDGLQSYAEYLVRFTNEGVYRVYVSGQRTASPQDPAEGRPVGDNDSMWVGALDNDHTATTGWHNFTFPAGGIFWRDTTVLWTIDNTNVNTDLTFTLGLREDGPIYDRIAFVLEGSGITATTIDSSIPLIVPEPATWLLGGTALMGIVALRRKRR
jgi:hypothetical protein